MQKTAPEKRGGFFVCGAPFPLPILGVGYVERAVMQAAPRRVESMKGIRFVFLWLVGIMSYLAGLLILTGSVLHWHLPSILLGLAGVALGFVSLLFASSHNRARFWAFALPAAVTTVWLGLSFFAYRSYRNPPPEIAADPKWASFYEQQAQQEPWIIAVLILGALPLVIAALIFRERAQLARNRRGLTQPSEGQP